MLKLATVGVLILMGCGSVPEHCNGGNTATTLDAGSVMVDAGVGITYEEEVKRFAETNGLTASWAEWMILHKADFQLPYTLARTELMRGRPARTLTVSVWYENQVEYNPPWRDETEHFHALEKLLEAQFPGWTIEMTTSRDANIEMGLGHQGNSYAGKASGVSTTGTKFLGFVYLNTETIAAHELAHVLGFEHHEKDGSDDIAITHPEEGKCVMGRDGYSFGPIETFLLKLDTKRSDEEIKPLMSEILSRYPD